MNQHYRRISLHILKTTLKCSFIFYSFQFSETYISPNIFTVVKRWRSIQSVRAQISDSIDLLVFIMEKTV